MKRFCIHYFFLPLRVNFYLAMSIFIQKDLFGDEVYNVGVLARAKGTIREEET